MTLVRMTLVLAFGAAAFACHKDDRSSQTTTTNASSTSNTGYEVAKARITGARCDREVSCEQIGKDKRFSTRELCARDEERRTTQELKASDCANGMDERKLQDCLSAISKQDCSALVGSLQSVDTCNTAALCVAAR